MDEDRLATTTQACTECIRVVMERVAAHMLCRSSVPMLLRRMTWLKAA
jgi:hypothetical protein